MFAGGWLRLALGEKRGHSQWHAYSDRQIEILRLFILWIAERNSINVRDGLIAEIKQKGAKAFELNEDAYPRMPGTLFSPP